MTTNRAGRNLLAASVILSVLTACGGGGGDGGGNPSPPPASGPNPAPPAPPPAPAPPAPPATSPVPAPGAGTASGDTFGVTSTGRLVTFDRADPALDTAIVITGLQSGETILGLDTRAGGSAPGQLYALGSSGRVYTIDATTGVATQASVLAADPADGSAPFTALSGTEFGVDFNPVADRLRVVSDTGQNLRIDVDTGATITDSPLTVGASARAGVTGTAYTNAFGAACRTSIYYIDTTTDELLTSSDPNGGALTSVGALGVDASAVGDFEIATAADGTNNGYAVLVVNGVPTSYQIDLDNGTVATAGAVTRLDSGEQVRDTAIAPPATAPAQDPGDLYAVTTTNRLVSFSSTAPQKVCTSVGFSGQQPNEAILSVDVRPADQQLYALGNSGRLYNLDAATGALSLKGTLVAALGDIDDPYVSLEGTDHGVDFNPGNDLLRVVADNGFNARVMNLDVVNGTTVTTDPDLNPAGRTIGAAAYGNGVAGTNISTFYMIDGAASSLTSLGGLTGTVTQIGLSLGIGTVSSVGGFDIYGTDNRGLAALSVGGDVNPSLYSIQLNTGLATAIGPIGTGEGVRSLTYAKAPTATLWGLTSAGRLVSFTLQNPGVFTSDVAVSGLQAGEALVAIDVRPADGVLYGLTSAGRLVPIDTVTGTAGAGVTLAANPADTTAPLYTALSGNRFGMDFHAFDDVLRIHSDTGQSLRVVAASGLASQDTNLQPAAGFAVPQVIGTAYNNSYVGGASTVSYVIDAANNRVMRHASVAGTMEFIGAGTGVDILAGGIQAEGDMDIAGGENGLVLAALLPVGATQSGLYRIAPATGAATAQGAIGPAGTVLTDFAIQLK